MKDSLHYEAIKFHLARLKIGYTFVRLQAWSLVRSLAQVLSFEMALPI